MAGGERLLCSPHGAEEMAILCDAGFHIKMKTQETGVHHRVPIENLCRQVFVPTTFTFCCDGIVAHLCLRGSHWHIDYLCGMYTVHHKCHIWGPNTPSPSGSAHKALHLLLFKK